jgi:hypothetical protein
LPSLGLGVREGAIVSQEMRMDMMDYSPDWWRDEDDDRDFLAGIDARERDETNPETGTLVPLSLREHLGSKKDPIYEILLKEIGRLKTTVHVMGSELRHADEFYRDLAEEFAETQSEVRQKDAELLSLRSDLVLAQSELEDIEAIALTQAEERREATAMDLAEQAVAGPEQHELFEPGFGD